MAESTLHSSSVLRAVVLTVAELPLFLHATCSQVRLTPGLKRLLVASAVGSMMLYLAARHMRRRRCRKKGGAVDSPIADAALNPLAAIARLPAPRKGRASGLRSAGAMPPARGPAGASSANAAAANAAATTSSAGSVAGSDVKHSTSVQSLASLQAESTGRGCDSRASASRPSQLRSRHSSVCAPAGSPWEPAGGGGEAPAVGSHTTPENLYLSGMELFEEALRRWEEALLCRNRREPVEEPCSDPEVIRVAAGDAIAEESTEDVMDGEFVNKLETLLTRAYRLQEEFECTMSSATQTPTRDLEGDMSLVDHSGRLFGLDTLSLSSGESFVSAAELVEELGAEAQRGARGRLALYEEAARLVRGGHVTCRSLRTEMLDCYSDMDYLAKLHCVRQAFQLLLEEELNKKMFSNMGRLIIAGLLVKAGKDPKGFVESYEEMLRYSEEAEHWATTQAELEGRGVRCMNFFDIVLDFILMDAFEDLESPPSTVLAVVHNRWLSDGFKETALATACWSVLKAKRRLLQVPDGFISRFYAISEHVSPVLAWGFLGCTQPLRDLCSFFKEQVVSLLRDVFDAEKVRYSRLEHLADDIICLFRRRSQILCAYLEVPEAAVGPGELDAAANAPEAGGATEAAVRANGSVRPGGAMQGCGDGELANGLTWGD
ncbi:mitoguardin 1 [Lampetra planeri]